MTNIYRLDAALEALLLDMGAEGAVAIVVKDGKYYCRLISVDATQRALTDAAGAACLRLAQYGVDLDDPQKDAA